MSNKCGVCDKNSVGWAEFPSKKINVPFCGEHSTVIRVAAEADHLGNLDDLLWSAKLMLGKDINYEQ